MRLCKSYRMIGIAVGFVFSIGLGVGPTPMPIFAQAPDLPHWQIEAEPDLTIGTADGPDEQVLARVSDAALLANGTIVIQNSVRGLFELRFFSAEGEFLGVASRWGEGPFEFEYSTGLHLMTGDSLLVTGTDGRFAVFGPSGQHVRAGHLSGFPTGFNRVAFANDRLVLTWRLGSNTMPPEGVSRSVLALGTYSLAEGRLAEVDTVLGRTTVSVFPQGPELVIPLPYPFAPTSYFAAGEGRIWVGATDDGYIRGLDPERGELEVVIELPAREAVSRRDQGDFEDWVASVARSRARGVSGTAWSDYHRDMQFPDFLPAFGDLLVDSRGNLWVQSYELPSDTDYREWVVYSPRGAPFARVTLPFSALPSCARSHLESCEVLLGIGEDHVLMIGGGEVPQVRRHRLVRSDDVR